MNNKNKTLLSVISYYFTSLSRADKQITTLIHRGDFFGDGPQFLIANAQEELKNAQTALERMIELRNSANPDKT